MTRKNRPRFRLLLVDDVRSFLQQLREYFCDVASEHYELEIEAVEARTPALNLLRGARDTGRFFNAAVLDYQLPDEPGGVPTKDFSLAEWCIRNPKVVQWVAQLSAYTGDSELQEFWTQQEFEGFSGRLLSKEDASSLKTIADAIFFREIKEPLRSEWLPAELGRDEGALGKVSKAPLGFDMYRFITRLGEVWPKLDNQSKQRAEELFVVEHDDEPELPPSRIGFRSF